MHLNIVC